MSLSSHVDFHVSESAPGAMSHSASGSASKHVLIQVAVPAGFGLQPPVPELECLAEQQRSHVELRPPRSRIHEILAVVFNNSQVARRHFEERLRREIFYTTHSDALTGPWDDECEVCLSPLYGYEDGSCVKCANTSVCRDCIQIFDPDNVDAACVKDLRRFIWDSRAGAFDESPLERGDPVCLQCGLYSPTERQRELYSLFNVTHDVIGVFIGNKVDRDAGSIRLALEGWRLSRRVKRVLNRRGELFDALHKMLEFLSYRGQMCWLMTSSGRGDSSLERPETRTTPWMQIGCPQTNTAAYWTEASQPTDGQEAGWSRTPMPVSKRKIRNKPMPHIRHRPARRCLCCP